MLALGLKVLAMQFPRVDAMALDRAMHEPDGWRCGDGGMRRATLLMT
jgi:hypothetical protein